MGLLAILRQGALAASIVAAPLPSPGAAPQDHRYATFRDPGSGTVLTYPASVFTRADDGTGRFAKFVSTDRLSTLYVVGRENDPEQSVADLSEAAEAALAEESARITYRRRKADWFVLSGFIGDNIFYRKTVLAHRGRTVGTFQINFPKEQKPFYYGIVERMSWSFKPRDHSSQGDAGGHTTSGAFSTPAVPKTAR
ncbi:hypothetical protein JL100_033900 (plasmid) [Skermanella mucosa]|uniref:hypothetical protein n=1 Tax=Skermanella mucosa TaxID=1789672 RepID=UPI00192AE481|nr:hypothetical protein [Skermanella mucosa]UEM25081.1 hypothetical protein JL100_033900 [Skermanella mucosa]